MISAATLSDDFVNDPKKGELVQGVVQPRYRDGWFNPIYPEDMPEAEWRKG